VAEVTLSIGGFQYRIACRDGDEANFLELGQMVDARVEQARAAVGPVSETRQLMMAALLFADEAREAAKSTAPESPTDTVSPDTAEGIATRLEQLASALELRFNQA